MQQRARYGAGLYVATHGVDGRNRFSIVTAIGGGFMTAIQMLKDQHREIEQLFKKIAAGNGNRAQWVDELAGMLRVHTRIEETIFYPAVQAHGTKRAQDEILESYEEHRIVDFLMAQLPAIDDQSEQFLARMRVLQSLVQEHIEEEETEVFKQAEALDDEQRAKLDLRMAEELREIEQVDELLDRVAGVARRTERWASALFDAGLAIPRRTVRAFSPSKWLGRPDQRYVWAARIATSMPRVLVDSVYRSVTGESSPQTRRAA
jgi:hemerythrin superfamily protein